MPILLKNRGLHTFSNELRLPEGAMTKADNIVIDRNDIITSRRGIADYGTVAPSTDVYEQIITYKERLLVHANDILYFDSDAQDGTFTAFNGTYTTPEAGIRLKYIESNSNLSK